MTHNKLEKYRQKIDVIDATIVKLLAKRMLTVKRIGKYKKRHGIDIVQEDRWEQVLKRIKRLGERTEVLDEEFIEAIWNEIHEFSKRSQSSS
ncbi:chorismate mutase [Candidatus Dojkabacteria bacterium]|uniref:Chorismate mutase n=1 Tax=Candidatus Dojkabacteria bacterium TaxID=2099670 RepID=A0A955RKN1_9BACT|nr:chorismate mutase [Candidatus Dojkabacteria bacterium]